MAAMSGAAMAENLSLDALSRPSPQSTRAQRLLMNSVVLAGKRLVAYGERGTVLLSDDDGKSWRQSKGVPVSVTLARGFFVNEKMGWAVGHSGVVLGTNDGGENWALLFDGKRAAILEKDAALAESATDERMANAERLAHDGADKPFFGVHFMDEKKGFVTGAYGLAFATEDGGKTWQSAIGRFENSKGSHLYSIYQNGQDLYVTGEQGALYRSTDSGKQFKRLKTPAKGTLFGITSFPDGALMVYGLRGAAFLSKDSGENWNKVDLPNSTITSAMRLGDGTVMLADETGSLLQSTNSGKSFKAVPQSQTSPVVGFVQTATGQLVLAGVGGMGRYDLKNKIMEIKK